MERFHRLAHSVWDCKYHLVWTTKYRYQVLGSEVGHRCRELLREIAMSKEMVIYAGSINCNHVHTLICIPPLIMGLGILGSIKREYDYEVWKDYT